MAEIEVRDLVFRVPTSGELTDRDIRDLGARNLEVDLADVILTNALAIPYRGQLLMRLVQRELALVMSLFHHSPPGHPLTRHPAYEGSSSHVRRFATEVAALGILNAVVTDRLGSAKVANFDALPLRLRRLYPSGTRPDLRFARDGQVLAGESRGRSRVGPALSPYRPEELRRLNELVEWTRQPNCDPVCMTWSWMQWWGTRTNFFYEDPLRPSPADGKPLRSSSPRGAWDSDGTDFDPPGVVDHSEFVRESDPHEGEKASALTDSRAKVEGELVESAPRERVAGVDGEWYGEWVDVPSLDDGVAAARLLVAASPTTRGKSKQSERLAQKTELSKELQLEVSLDGRIMVAIDWRHRDPTETGQLVNRLIQLDATD